VQVSRHSSSTQRPQSRHRITRSFLPKTLIE
jgi:hypothetical protein